MSYQQRFNLLISEINPSMLLLSILQIADLFHIAGAANYSTGNPLLDSFIHSSMESLRVHYLVL
jgi:hypothetical protein